MDTSHSMEGVTQFGDEVASSPTYLSDNASMRDAVLLGYLMKEASPIGERAREKRKTTDLEDPTPSPDASAFGHSPKKIVTSMSVDKIDSDDTTQMIRLTPLGEKSDSFHLLPPLGVSAALEHRYLSAADAKLLEDKVKSLEEIKQRLLREVRPVFGVLHGLFLSLSLFASLPRFLYETSCF